MNINQIAFLQSVLPGADAEFYKKYHGDDSGWLVIDDRPREGRKLMLFYTGCNGRQLRDYIKTYRPEIYAEYFLVQIYVHSLVISSIWKKEFPYPELITKLFNNADVLVYNPVGANYNEYSDQIVLRHLNLSAKALSYSSQHAGCWWVICPLFGEDCVHDYFDKGMGEEDVWQKLNDGTFDPKFAKRFDIQMAWLDGHEAGCDAGSESFIRDHYKDCKMWFTLNHPTYNVVAHICDNLMEKIGFKGLGVDHALTLQPDRCMLSDYYPETHYEFEYYKFKYPIRFTKGHGGMSFFRKCIKDARERWVEKRKGEA